MSADPYVFQVGASSINSTPVEQFHVAGGTGAFNSIVIEDMDLDLRNELYVAGTQGILKWRQL